MKQDTQPLLIQTPPKVAKPAKREIMSEQEGKTLYHSAKPDLIIQEFRTVPGEEGKRSARVKDVSALRNEISCYLFGYIEGFQIPTHFVSKFSATAMVVRRLEMIPLVVRIYNTSTGPMLKRFGLKEGSVLDFPVMEHYYTQGRKQPGWVNEYHMFAFNIVSPDELRQINRMASKVNAVLRGLCDRRKLAVADLQLAFGKFKNQIVVGDELSPFTCHFLDLGEEGKRAQDRYLPDQDRAAEAFSELDHRFKMKA